MTGFTQMGVLEILVILSMLGKSENPMILELVWRVAFLGHLEILDHLMIVRIAQFLQYPRIPGNLEIVNCFGFLGGLGSLGCLGFLRILGFPGSLG